MKNIVKTNIIIACALIALTIVWFTIGCCYENHYGAGIINRTQDLLWMKDVMTVLCALSALSILSLYILAFFEGEL